jgi:cytochrome c peroxidase
MTGPRRSRARWPVAVVLAGLLAGRAEGRVFPTAPRSEPIRPIPAAKGLDPRKVELGARLFADPRLSRDDTISCASCHDLARGGVDRLPRSVGVGGVEAGLNAPTVFNSSLNFRQFWDGRARTLEEQIDGPVSGPREMATSWEDVLPKLRRDDDLMSAFAALYPDGLQAGNVKDAIAAFERSLTTPNSRFDRWLLGDEEALTSEELRGYQLFKSYGCAACHQGVNVGGNMFQSFGVMGDYFADRGSVTAADLGRFNVTGEERDRHRFRVPSLRLAVLTPPYFHDGSAATLEEAIDVMARYQLGRPMPPEDRALVIRFLWTLPGDYAGRPLVSEGGP